MTHNSLRRELGVPSASLLGLGSILGTGVFVSIGIAAGITGPSVVLAVALAAFVAVFNGSSSAQLASAHAVSGGTYEYGYRFLTPMLGFVAGWVFLLAKSASAATAALGFSGYGLNLIQVSDGPLTAVAVAAVTVVVLVVLAGVRLSSQVNTVVVVVTVAALAVFVVVMLGDVDIGNFSPIFSGGDRSRGGFFEATALLFVAYTGYGRIATLGEEVREPTRTIPLAMGAALLLTGILYVAVAFAAVGAAGAGPLADAAESTAAPLEAVARSLDRPLVATLVSIGAVSAMLGVLLNLILGLSRVLLAMGRRGDMPAATARIDRTGRTPYVAVVCIGLVVLALTLTGDVRLTWTFSALNVLIYYAITNAAAWRLPSELRRFPRWLAAAGFTGCLFLVAFIEWRVWLAGAALIVVGLAWHLIARRRR
jgi:APA family basic amino acid/polyamine antiporter